MIDLTSGSIALLQWETDMCHSCCAAPPKGCVGKRPFGSQVVEAPPPSISREISKNCAAPLLVHRFLTRCHYCSVHFGRRSDDGVLLHLVRE